MSNYPDNVDFSQMGWERRLTAADYEARRDRDEARCELIKRAEAIGAALKGSGITHDGVSCFSDALCEALIEVPFFAAVLSSGSGVDGYELAEQAMLRTAFPQAIEEDAA